MEINIKVSAQEIVDLVSAAQGRQKTSPAGETLKSEREYLIRYYERQLAGLMQKEIPEETRESLINQFKHRLAKLKAGEPASAVV